MGFDLSRRKDRERYLRLKQANPDYSGYRGPDTPVVRPPAPLETVVCSVCQRRRNVPVDTIPDDVSSFVCLTCRESEPAVADPAV
jgi:hypothetical protein